MGSVPGETSGDQVLHRLVAEGTSDVQTVVSAGGECRFVSVKVGLDNFGTGHSSLSCLRMFPLDFVKIDQSYVQGLIVGRSGPGIVASIAHADLIEQRVLQAATTDLDARRRQVPTGWRPVASVAAAGPPPRTIERQGR